MQSQVFNISEVANLYGLSLRTLRFYEQKGLLKPTRVGVHRLYGARDRIILELILKGKRLGFSLTEIELLINANAQPDQPAKLHMDQEVVVRQIKTLEQKRHEIDTSIVELRQALGRE